MKKRFSVRLSALFLMLLLLMLFCACQQPSHNPPSTEETETTLPIDTVLTVYFMNFGSADCMILKTESHLVLIDTGEEEHGDNVTEALSLLGAEKVDCLILTHPDKDHIGGAPAVLGTVLTETVYMPDYQKDSVEQRRLNSAIASTPASTAITLTRTVSFYLDEVKFTIYPTQIRHKGKDPSNEYSLGVLVEHGNNRLFFAGDAVGERLDEMAEQIPNPETIDLLKVPHHGRFDSSSDDLIRTLTPRSAVICCSGKEPPDRRILTLLNEIHADHYLTSHGIIMVQSDGNRLHIED